jgi:hypothetical protein
VNGDSYSAPDNHKVWADYVAVDLGLPLTNLAVSGSNNKRIMRSTIEYIESDGMIGKNPLVIIAWSFIRRLEVWYYGESEKIKSKAPDNHSRVSEDRYRFITLDWLLGTKESTDYHKNLVIEDRMHLHKILVDFYTDLFLFSAYLNAKNIDYLFFSGANNEECNPYWFVPATDLHMCYHVLNNNRVKSIHDFSIAHWAKQHDKDCTETWHLSENGHKDFSKIVGEFLQK